MKKYHPHDGELLEIAEGTFRHVCCKCKRTHRVEVLKRKGKWFTAWFLEEK